MTSRSYLTGYQRFCDNSTITEERDKGGGGLKIIQNCVKSFMDDALYIKLKFVSVKIYTKNSEIKFRKSIRDETAPICLFLKLFIKRMTRQNQIFGFQAKF
jgi:hypothetical protein